LFLAATVLFFTDPVHITTIGNSVEHTVRIRDIAETLVLIGEQSFLAHYFIIFDDDAVYMQTAQTRNKKIVGPFWNRIAFVKTDTTWRNHGIPIINGLFHACFLLYAGANFFAAVLNSISDGWPAVVFSCAYKI
jgi:hypothetical protein